MIARILRRGLSDEDNEHLPRIKGQLTSAPLPLPNTKGSAGEKAVRATATVGATPMTPFSSTKEGGESEAKKLNQHDIQSDTSQHHAQTEQPQRYRTLKNSYGRRRETSRFGEQRSKTSRKCYRRRRETSKFAKQIQKMLQAVNERREAMDLQEGNPRQRLAAVEWEENPRPREAARTQQMATTRQPNSAAREADILSLSSFSTIRNSPRIRGNVDISPESSARSKQDSRYHDSDVVSLASTSRSSSSKHTNIDFSSSKSHARLKEDSEYYGNE